VRESPLSYSASKIMAVHNTGTVGGTTLIINDNKQSTLPIGCDHTKHMINRDEGFNAQH